MAFSFINSRRLPPGRHWKSSRRPVAWAKEVALDMAG
jgi:hypothetical protein